MRNSRGASLLAWLGKQRTREALIGYLFILPALIGFIIFYALPAVRGLLISFTNWNLLTPAEYVGFQNYQRLFNDPGFWNSVQVTVRYVAFNIPLQIIIAMALALFMDRVSQRSAWLRNIIIIPWLLPGVVVACSGCGCWITGLASSTPFSTASAFLRSRSWGQWIR
ncbi:sugar ABC transporter permease [Geitlerinema splendidum]|nr:sugar ABC transporter permease [Geitlerinema splendidum]